MKRIKKIYNELRRMIYWHIFFTMVLGCGGPAFSSAEGLENGDTKEDSGQNQNDAGPTWLDSASAETGRSDAAPETSLAPESGPTSEAGIDSGAIVPDTGPPDSAPETGPRDRGRPPCVEGSPCFIRSGAWVCCGGTSSCPQPAEAELFCCIRNVECK